MNFPVYHSDKTINDIDNTLLKKALLAMKIMGREHRMFMIDYLFLITIIKTNLNMISNYTSCCLW